MIWEGLSIAKIGILIIFGDLNRSRLENTCICLHHVTKMSHGTERSFGIRSNRLSLPHPLASNYKSKMEGGDDF